MLKLVLKILKQAKNVSACKQLLQLEEDDILGNGDVCQIFDLWSMDLRTFCKFSTEVLKFIAFELFLGIEHLHRNGVGHRDIKPDNIFVNADHVPLPGRLWDADGAVGLFGTIAHGALEISATMQYDCRIDWFFVGVSLYSIVTGTELFARLPIQYDRQHCPRYMGLALTGKLRSHPWYQGTRVRRSCHFEDFVNGLLRVDVNKRLDAPGIRAHPFVQDVPSRSSHWEDYMFEAPVQPKIAFWQTLTGQNSVAPILEIVRYDSDLLATMFYAFCPIVSPPISTSGATENPPSTIHLEFKRQPLQSDLLTYNVSPRCQEDASEKLSSGCRLRYSMDLKSYIEQYQLTERSFQFVAFQILKAIETMHRLGFMHLYCNIFLGLTLLAYDADERLGNYGGAALVLSHPYFAGVPTEILGRQCLQGSPAPYLDDSSPTPAPISAPAPLIPILFKLKNPTDTCSNTVIDTNEAEIAFVMDLTASSSSIPSATWISKAVEDFEDAVEAGMI
ncbi:Serine/threonine kinase [Phlyctochytrium planicorne]|nr:Serine/threonine kinase [Phlyctochytrium planicorne]